MHSCESEFQNILIICLGQLGDVILSLPAIHALRLKFPASRITVLVGAPAVGIVDVSGLADEVISIDRSRLKKGPKLRSILELFRFAGDIRRRKFDLVIDLQSFYETNLLGWLSRSPNRIFANRDRRSLDFLSKFPTRPPLEDRTRHQTDRYLSVLEPLGITAADRMITVRPREDDRRDVTEMLKSHDAQGKKLVGLFFGAGHPTRRWSIERFARLAERLSMHGDLRVLILMGPEERAIRREATDRLSKHALVVDELSLTSFFAALSLLDVLVCGDTGPAHLAALAGVPMVLLAEKHVPTIFFPLTDRLTVLAAATVNEISVDDVYESVMRSVKDGSQDKE